MVEGGRAAQLADRGETVRQRFGRVVEELQLVGGPGDPPSALAPLSDTTMIRVLSNSPVSFRKSSSRPI
jgi:hypothetical protein